MTESYNNYSAEVKQFILSISTICQYDFEIFFVSTYFLIRMNINDNNFFEVT